MLIRKMAASLVLLLVATVPARAQDVDLVPAPAAAVAERPDIRIKKDTGRDAANYPPDLLFDHEHMLLEMNIPDIAVKEFSARETLRSRAMGKARAQMVLDARETITVKTITVNGQGTTFTHEKNKLAINMLAPVKPGETVTVVIDYDAKNPGRDGNGLNWLKGREAKPAAEGEEARPEVAPMVYSQGESCWNSFWFPCHDFPNDKLTTEIIINVQEGFEVVSNGRLVSKEPAAGQEGQPGRFRWHWLQDKPHATYLVMIAIGKWDVVDVGGPETKRPGLLIPVYGKPGSAEVLKKTFTRTPDMIAFFEEKFAQPYPWDKYAQVLVRNFRWGGMENTSATTLGDFAGGGGDQDGLIAHELAHQWFGDLVTCKSWAHLWLNEGWATYSEALWLEHHKDHKTYLKTIRDSFNGQRGGNRSSSPGAAAMVSNYYNDPDEPFTKSDNPYGKGAAILHMLRVKIGDEAFFGATRAYLERYKFKSTETDDFRKVMEEFSGQSLERFFTQWCARPGLPRMAVEYTYDESAKTLTVKIDQTQRVDGDNPAYAFSVSFVLFAGEGGEQEAGTVTMSTQTTSATATFPVASRPTRIAIDPDLHVLAQWKVTKKIDDPTDAPKEGAKKAEEAKPEAKPEDGK